MPGLLRRLSPWPMSRFKVKPTRSLPASIPHTLRDFFVANFLDYAILRSRIVFGVGMRTKFPARSLLAAAVFLVMAGCATHRPGQSFMVHEPPMADVGDAWGASEISLNWMPSDMFVLKSFEGSSHKGLPRFAVKGISFSDMGAADAVRLVAAKAGLGLRLENGTSANLFGKLTVDNLSGSLEEVLDAMAESAGFFWDYRGGALVVRMEDSFIVQVPPVLDEDTMAGFNNTLAHLGARELYLDRANRTLAFKADARAMRSIDRYLDRIRKTRSLLYYDISVYQVDLQDDHAAGVNWNQLNLLTHQGLRNVAAAGASTLGAAGTAMLPAAANGVAAAATIAPSSGVMTLGLAANKFSMTSLVSFLNTQGTVKSLASPKIGMLSGSSSSFRVGKTTTYISKVGSSTTTGIAQLTTETASLRTGLSLELRGDLDDNTVMTHVSLNIAEILGVETFEAVGTQLALPQTQDRDLDTLIRARPGDVTILGGILMENESKTDKRGLGGVSDDHKRSRSELVLLLRTRVVHFVPTEPVKPPETAAVAAVATEAAAEGVKAEAAVQQASEQRRQDAARIRAWVAKQRAELHNGTPQKNEGSAP